MLAEGLWLVVTMVSTAIVWTATSTVAAGVTDRPAPVVPHDDVVSQLSRPPGDQADRSEAAIIAALGASLDVGVALFLGGPGRRPCTAAA